MVEGERVEGREHFLGSEGGGQGQIAAAQDLGVARDVRGLPQQRDARQHAQAIEPTPVVRQR